MIPLQSCSREHCHGRAEDIAATEDSCVCTCVEGYAGADCGQCAAGWGRVVPSPGAGCNRVRTDGLSPADVAAIVAGVAAGLLSGTGVLYRTMSEKARQQERGMQKLKDDKELLEDVVDSIATMQLERVGYLANLEHPTRVQHSLGSIVRMLEQYRAYSRRSQKPAMSS
eukprot:gene718-biopygen13314